MLTYVVEQAARSSYSAAPLVYMPAPQADIGKQQNANISSNERPIVRISPAASCPQAEASVKKLNPKEIRFFQLNLSPLQWNVQTAAFEALVIQSLTKFLE